MKPKYKTKKREESRITNLCIMLLICGACFVGCTKTVLISSEEAFGAQRKFHSDTQSEGIVSLDLKTGEMVIFIPGRVTYDPGTRSIKGVVEDSSAVNIHLNEIEWIYARQTTSGKAKTVRYQVKAFKDQAKKMDGPKFDENKQVQSVWLCSGVRRAVLKSGEYVDFDVQRANLSVRSNRLLGIATNGSSIDIPIEKISHVEIQNDAIITFDKQKGRLNDDKDKIVGMTLDGKRLEIPRDEVLYVKTKVTDKTKNFLLGGFVAILVVGIIDLAANGYGLDIKLEDLPK